MKPAPAREPCPSTTSSPSPTATPSTWSTPSRQAVAVLLELLARSPQVLGLAEQVDGRHRQRLGRVQHRLPSTIRAGRFSEFDRVAGHVDLLGDADTRLDAGHAPR